MSNERLERLFDRLKIEEGNILMLHTAFARLQDFVSSPAQLIDSLMARLGRSGTLVMPRYAWHLFPDARPWKGYAEYLQTLPLMDLRHTPANIGVVPDLFRKLEGIRTSISHFWPVSARGPDAERLLHNQAEIDHAYGPNSVFARLVECNATIVGLGVTLNTTSTAPVVDWQLGLEHQRKVFTDAPVAGVVIDDMGQKHLLKVATMRPQTVRDIKPSRILSERLRPDIDFPFLVENGSFFFSYRASLYQETALSEAQVSRRQGSAVPWLS